MKGTPTALESKHRLFLADDHPLVRDWAATVINGQPDLMVCGMAETEGELLSAIRKMNVDLAVVDITIPGSLGVEMIQKIHRISKSTAILVLSNLDESIFAPKVLRSGALAFVHKRNATTDFIPAIRAALQGEVHLSGRLQRATVSQIQEGRRSTGIAALSTREFEVFQLLGQGCGTRAIAEGKHISIKTVQMYCARMKAKLGLKSGSYLVRQATIWWESQQNS